MLKGEVWGVVEDGLKVYVGWYKGENVGMVKVKLEGFWLEWWKEKFKRGCNLIKVWRDGKGEWRVG